MACYVLHFLRCIPSTNLPFRRGRYVDDCCRGVNTIEKTHRMNEGINTMCLSSGCSLLNSAASREFGNDSNNPHLPISVLMRDTFEQILEVY